MPLNRFASEIITIIQDPKHHKHVALSYNIAMHSGTNVTKLTILNAITMFALCFVKTEKNLNGFNRS